MARNRVDIEMFSWNIGGESYCSFSAESYCAFSERRQLTRYAVGKMSWENKVSTRVTTLLGENLEVIKYVNPSRILGQVHITAAICSLVYNHSWQNNINKLFLHVLPVYICNFDDSECILQLQDP